MRPNSNPFPSSPGKKIDEQLENPQNYLTIRPIKIDYDHERFKNIKHEFKIMDKDNNQLLSQDEILEYLKNVKKVQQLNMKIIHELFDTMDSNSDGRVSLEEFAHNYICREFELKREIAAFEDQELNLEDEKASIMQLLGNRYRANNRYVKICLEQANLSQFTIYQKLYETESFSVKAIICCDKVRLDHFNEISTKLSQNITFPAWHETVQFEIDSSVQEIDTITVQIKFVKQMHENERRITSELNQTQFAESSIQIAHLGKEFHADSWIDIMDAKDKQIKIGVVHVLVDYIPDEVVFRKNRLLNIEDQLESLHSKKEFKVMELNYLKNLFGTLHHNPQEIRKKSQAEEELQRSEVDFFSIFSLAEYQQSAIDEFDFHETFKTRDYAIYCLVVLTLLLLLFQRCDFLGFVILSRVIPFIGKNWNNREVIFFLLTLAFSAFTDFIYLILLREGITTHDYLGQRMVNIMAWVLTIISVLFKCGFVVYCMKDQEITLSQIFLKKEIQNPSQEAINSTTVAVNNNINNNNIQNSNLNSSFYKSQFPNQDLLNPKY